jgi:putative transposase
MFPSLDSFSSILKTTTSGSNIRTLYCLIKCFFCVQSKVTTRSLSRSSSYSLRHIFRFLNKEIDWLSIRILLFIGFDFSSSSTYIFATDETVEGKSGKHSYGLSQFYSSCDKQPIKGICVSALCLIEVESKTSFMIDIEQVVYSEADKLRIADDKTKKKAATQRLANGGAALKRGRKEGTKNKPKEEEKTEDKASLRAFRSIFSKTLTAFCKYLPALKVKYIVGDTAYANENYAALVEESGLFLISKLYKTAAVFEVKNKTKGGITYGDKFDLHNLDKKYLQETEKDDKEMRTEIYQLEGISKAMSKRKINVVVHKTIRKDGKESVHIFFSTDLKLDYKTMIKYYRIRFQIEFDFRDAKQHFGLSDFKNYKEKNMKNFINLSFTMTLISKSMVRKAREKYENENLGILDLKVLHNHQFHTKSIINWFRNNPNPNFNSLNEEQFMPHDLINAA